MSLTTQFYTMLAMIAMGSFFGGTLDTYNRFLKRKKRKRWIVFIHDLFFWIFQGLVLFYVLFMINFGEVRFYIFVAILCGFAAYQALMREIYLKLLESFIFIIKTMIHFLANLVRTLIYQPIKGLILLFISLLTGSVKLLYTIVKTVMKMLIWVIKIIFKPLLWLFAALSYLMPKGMKRWIENVFVSFAGKLRWLKNINVYIKEWIQRIFHK
ncbi:spore cortex biosynthesis protein YabQ [Heyndrickxia ginsengihumi]|uniref:Spore cortex biosynthesis protein YabQ n=1 Tax=Heyndrickxia ginsengihumi TaxID=363870 RepID=A0A6M0P8U4_9BACI|nr:spore cortex biosynthesis protein YabQ [Heyndrickxia ginsengihumi]MBE6183228.1 spore cortex biosynthesis protein YabQ [Bacillus sp. (in: firmicutes)]MCM3024342.1 spore cortex biosynthesis protein YabQ [Heyndrickxia ginsengihumi]NEY21144.1 spore cortex biosynthesis protein YabQ [Heyndrickxia ginsengihumi]